MPLWPGQKATREEKFEAVAQAILRASNNDRSTVDAKWDELEHQGIGTWRGHHAYLRWAINHSNNFIRHLAIATLKMLPPPTRNGR